MWSREIRQKTVRLTWTLVKHLYGPKTASPCTAFNRILRVVDKRHSLAIIGLDLSLTWRL